MRGLAPGARPARMHALPYRADSAALFESIADEPWAVFLDSGPPESRRTHAHLDILAARPWATLECLGARSRVRHFPRSGAARERLSADDPFDLLRGLLAENGAAENAPAPFSGGAIGYCAYDLAARFMPRAALPPTDIAHAPPLMAVGLYAWAVVTDHAAQHTWLLAHGRHAPDDAEWAALIARFSAAPAPRPREAFRVHGPLRETLAGTDYAAAFARVRAYIRAGDCYQVNLARGFEVEARGDAWLAYQALRRANPAPHAAYLNLPGLQVLSCSPERFVSLRDGAAETRPIKGTRPRGASPEADAALARELAESAKDRAENLMIVDLLRNDLGKVCAPGSIHAPALFNVESFARVHHLVSTVRGRLRPGEDALSLLRAAFPGGSITGAPKLRAMQIIAELEPEPRGLYCGNVFWMDGKGDMDSNILIRTLTLRDKRLRFSAGGGLVADSDPEAEYAECNDKAAVLLDFIAAHRDPA